jgi:hypothetical protein
MGISSIRFVGIAPISDAPDPLIVRIDVTLNVTLASAAGTSNVTLRCVC